MVVLIKETYLYHKMEFRRHIKSMLINFVATEISLILIVLFCTFTLFFTYCLEELDYMRDFKMED